MVLAAAVAVGGFGATESRADEKKEYMPKAVSTKLLQTPLAGAPGKEVHIIHVAAPPGYVGGRHMHTGPVFVYILEGKLTIQLDGQEPVVLGPGDVYQEPTDGKAMQAFNKSATHGVKLVAFQVGDKGVPMMVKAE
jgi:quercetin dioxygenase-like cupin family protein